MSERQPVILLVAKEGVTHQLLGALLGEECAFLGARTAAAALQLVRRRPPDVVIVDDSFDDLDALTAGLRDGAPNVRTIVLATPTRHGSGVARLAAFGAVITKPYDNEHLRTLVLNTARLSWIAGDPEGPISKRSDPHGKTKM